MRRFGLTQNLVRHVDVARATREAAYKTLLSTDELRGVMAGTGARPVQRAVAWLGKKLVRSTDVFTVAVKPFMDVHTYDQDRVANCCHHLMTTRGEADVVLRVQRAPPAGRPVGAAAGPRRVTHRATGRWRAMQPS